MNIFGVALRTDVSGVSAGKNSGQLLVFLEYK